MRNVYTVLCLLFFHCFSTTLCAQDTAPWKVEITKDQEKLIFAKSLTVTIHCDYPASYIPNVFEFLLRQEGITQYGYFNLLHSSYKDEQGHLVIQLKLQPRAIGRLIFTPGILTFTPIQQTDLTHELLVPAFAIECSLALPAPQRAPLLPLHPESVVTLSSENREAFLESVAVLEKEQRRSVLLSSTHTFAWTLLLLIFIGICGAIIIFWVFKEAEEKPKPKPPEKRDLKKEFMELLQSQDELTLRLSKLSRLLRDLLSAREKKPLQGLSSREVLLVIEASQNLNLQEKELLRNLFLKLDAREFSQEKISEDEWQALKLDELSQLF